MFVLFRDPSQVDTVGLSVGAEKYANAIQLFIQNMKRANAIRPYGIVDKYSLGSHIHTMILVHPLIPSILVQILQNNTSIILL